MLVSDATSAYSPLQLAFDPERSAFSTLELEILSDPNERFRFVLSTNGSDELHFCVTMRVSTSSLCNDAAFRRWLRLRSRWAADQI